jgi:hypothetical protein
VLAERTYFFPKAFAVRSIHHVGLHAGTYKSRANLLNLF